MGRPSTPQQADEEPERAADTDLAADPYLTGEPEFTEEPGFGIRIPLDLDRWVPWVGAALILAASVLTVLGLVAASLEGWAGVNGPASFPALGAADPLVLLAGVMVLVLRRAQVRRGRWLGALACMAIATGTALLITQLVGGIETAVTGPSGSAVFAGVAVLQGIASAALAVIGAAAVVLAALLYRWSRQFGATAAGLQERRDAGRAAGWSARGAQGTGDTESAKPMRPMPIQRAFGAMVLGGAAGVACLIAFQAGVGRAATVVSPPSTSITPPAPSATPISGAPYRLPTGCIEFAVTPNGLECFAFESPGGSVPSTPLSGTGSLSAVGAMDCRTTVKQGQTVFECLNLANPNPASVATAN